MLTSNLVRVRESNGVLRVSIMRPDAQKRLLQLVQDMASVVEHSIGESRQNVEAALDAVEVRPSERKLALAVRKLVLDACEFEKDKHGMAYTLRRDLFLQAAIARKQAQARDDWKRASLLQAVAVQHGFDVGQAEQMLFADLPSEHKLKKVDVLSPQSIVDRWSLLQAQGVLLKAIRVEAWVSCSEPANYRNLFRRIKFLGLLPHIESMHNKQFGRDGYAIALDGPLSLFGPSTKYGLQLAQLIPLLEQCDVFYLRAQVRWGAQRIVKTFELDHLRTKSHRLIDTALPSEQQELLTSFERLNSGWTAEVATEVFHIPNVGVWVPDLMFRHDTRGSRVFVEILGYWSRDAVWKRIEMVENGLKIPAIFAINERLRVSEKVLSEHAGARLYAYKTKLSAKALRQRLDEFLPVD